MRKLIRIAATAIAALAMAGAAKAQDAALTSIEVSVAPSGFKALYQSVADAFMQQNPAVKVRLRVSNTYPEQTQGILRDAITGGMPDVAHIAYDQIRIIADRRQATPISDFIKTETNWRQDAYPASVAAMGSANGQFYAMPFWTSLPVVFYNADLVRRAGGDPEHFPNNWADLIALGQKIQALGENGVTGLFLLYRNAGWPFQALVLSHGGQLMSPDEKTVAFNSPAGVSSLTLLRDLKRAGMIEMTKEQGRQAFAAGKLGILVDAHSNLGSFEKQAAGRFQVGVAIHPIPAADGKLPAGGNAMMVLTKDSRKQKVAWDYIKFASAPIGQTIVAKSTGSIPVSQEAIRDPALLKAFYDENPNSRLLLQALPKMTVWYSFPGQNSNKITDVIEDHLQSVFGQKETPEEAMAKMTKEVEALLPR